MNLRFPLWTKVSIWLVANLAVLGAVGAVIFFQQLRSGQTFLTGRAAQRVQTFSNIIRKELESNPTRDRDDLLANFSDNVGLEFLIVGVNGAHIAGPEIPLPPEVSERIKALTPPPMPPSFQRGGGGRGGPPGRQGGPGGGGRGFPQQARGGAAPVGSENASPAPVAGRVTFGEVTATGRGLRGGPIAPGSETSRFMLPAGDPTRYWIGTRFGLPVPNERDIPSVLIAVTDSLDAAGLILDFRPLFITAGAVAVLSILFWLPMVSGVTRTLHRLAGATEKIAEGRFETRVEINRSDELGRLGESVNLMAGRLDTLVNGQKRFLGDIAHELGSPIARMQFATSVLEDKADPSLKGSIADVREEVQNMSELVNELLAFTRAGLKAREAVMTDVELAPLVTRALDREDAGSKATATIPVGLKVRCDEGMLARAVHNLVRNALRYAAADGPISVEAVKVGSQVKLTIADVGPGVPPEAIARLGEPFYRPETARSRDTGGVGLGLAIVKGAVKAIGGSVVFSNRTPRGFSAEITLDAASS